MDFYSAAILSVILVSILAGVLSFWPRKRKWPKGHGSSYFSSSKRISDE